MSYDDPLLEYLDEVAVVPEDYDSEQEASLALPIEYRLLQETDQKYKVTFDSQGDRVYYEERLGGGRIGPTNTLAFNWEQEYNDLLQEANIDEDVQLVEKITERILEELQGE